MKRCRDCSLCKTRRNKFGTGLEVYCSMGVWPMDSISFEAFEKNPLAPVVVGPRPPRSKAEYCVYYDAAIDTGSSEGSEEIPGVPEEAN